MTHVVYFGQTPDLGTGSPIILLRHLRRLAANGWKISVVGESGQSANNTQDWPLFHLSLRKPWWPPFRPDNALLRGVRMRLWARECAGFFKQAPQAVLTYMSLYSELHSEVAAHYALRCGAPLTVIVHDYPPDFPDFPSQNAQAVLRRQHWILRNARNIWFVSPELADKYDLPAEKKKVLPPIPEGCATPARWRAAFAEKPLILYAGYSYPAQIPLFRKLARAIDAAGGRLMILSRKTPEIEALCATEPVEHRALFATNREALDFVSSTAAALLVSYCERVEEMPWITTSFPSKFAEFSHAGLPTLLVAPQTSAIGGWARRASYPDYVDGGQLHSVAAFVEALKSEAAWNQKSELVTRFAQTEFNPHVIHAALESQLTNSQ
ncbi:MAG: hypothetical protein NTZ46_00095 [Verrucomicrobia bacterium]|nr:hypothetical protein [Verrucomicrobiota bacterium]